MNVLFHGVLQGLVTHHLGIFILLGLSILIFVRKFLSGLQEWQKAIFGLERDIARRKLVSASTGLLLLLLLIIGEFLLVTVVGPQLPNMSIEEMSSIETVLTSTPTLEEPKNSILGTPDVAPAQEALVSDCIQDQVEITSPADGEEVSGTVELIGSVNVENFGSYKYEYSTTGTINWVTIAAGDQLKLEESLGFWYTSSLPPGDYLLRLVPLDNTGRDMTPCIIYVEVVSEE